MSRGPGVLSALTSLLREVSAKVAGVSSSEVRILMERLSARPHACDLRDLAELRERARGAGAQVTRLMDHASWDVRIAAALTLGYIQYAKATDALITRLDAVEDWRQVLVAAEALGRLRAEQAREALTRVARTHWFAPVRAGAHQALRVIAGEEAYPVSDSQGFASEFFSYEHAGGYMPALRGPRLMQGPDELPEFFLAEQKYVGLKQSQDDGPQRMVPTPFRPTCGVRVPGGLLLGSDRGEWGGELVLQRDDATEETLLYSNIQNIHRLGGHLVAVTGLAHLNGNKGMLYRLEPRDLSYVATCWRALPGAPERSGWLPDARLFISTVSGDVVVSADGTLESVPRGPRAPL